MIRALAALKHPRYLMFLAVFLPAAALLRLWRPLEDALVLGFDLAAILFVASAGPLWRADRIEAIRARAARDDGGRTLLILVSFIVLGIVLTALGWILRARHTLAAADVVLIAGTLLLAWVFVNLIYAFHYAHLYYDDEATPCLDFPGEDPPLFADFCYFAFVIGMTFQVSDVTIATTHVRRQATVHALFAFVFNMGVVALTVNLLAGVV